MAELDSIEVEGRRFIPTVASDIRRDGIALEVDEIGDRPLEQVLEVFYSDIDGTLTLTRCEPGPPAEVVRWALDLAKERLIPRAADEDPRSYEDDRSLVRGLIAAGRDPSHPQKVAHYFSSPGRRPDETASRLQDEYEVVMDEEVTGDGFWHVAAFTNQLVTLEEVTAARRRMVELAAETGVTYDGWTWKVTPAGYQRS